MGDTPFKREASEARRRGQQGTSGAVGTASFAASAVWSATAADGGTSYLAQRKEQIYGVFADEVEDKVEEEQAARKSVKKTRNEQLLLVSGSSSSEEEGERSSIDGRSSGEGEDEDIPEGCVTGRGSRSSSKSKSSRHYGRRIKFVRGGMWKPDTVHQQKKQKTGEQRETGYTVTRSSSTSATGAGGEPLTDAASAEGEEHEGTNSADTQIKHPRAAAAAGVFEEEGEEEEAEANEAGCMSLRERILNAQVLKEVLGDAYYDLSSEDDDVKAAVGKSQQEAAVAAEGTESSRGANSSSNGSSNKVTKESPEGVEAGASDAAAGGLGDRAATSRGSQQSGRAAGAAESSSSDEDAEEGTATERATVRQRSFRFSSSSSRGEAGAQLRQHAAPGEGGTVQPAKEKNTWGFAKMEKTYGVGFKLLKKMGFKGGGLGRHGTGVANPLEVRIREKNKGLQDSGEKVERKKAVRGKQLTALDILLGARKREKSAVEEAAEAFAEAWKKPGKVSSSSGGASGAAGGLSAAERRRRRLGGLSPAEMAALRVKELQHSYRSSSSSAVRRQGPAVRIIDMTGPEARLIENESELQQTLQQQKQRAAAAGARRGRKLGGGEKAGAPAERDMGREDDDRSEGALLSDEESPAAVGDLDEEESAENARVRNLPFKALRQQLEAIVRDVEAQLESIVRDKKVGEQLLLESVDYVPIAGAAGASSGLFGRVLQCKSLAATSAGERPSSATLADGGTADAQQEQNASLPSGHPAAGAGEAAPGGIAAAAQLYEEEVAAAVCDACVVADRATALLQRVQALYHHVTGSSKRIEAAGAAPSHGTAANSAAGRKQSKNFPADQADSSDHKKAAAPGLKPACRKHTSSRPVAGDLVEESDRWSGSEGSSKSRSPSVDSIAPSRKGSSTAAGQSSGDAPLKSSAAEGGATDAGTGASSASGDSSSAGSSAPYCSVDLDSLVVAAEEWRSTARFEFRLLQVPAVLAALAGLILERRLRTWTPLEASPRALEAESAATSAAASEKAAAELHIGGAGGVTASSVSRLLAFLVSLQQHEEAETRVFLSAVTAADEKVRASSAAGSACCWAAGLLAAATPGAAGGRGEATGRGAAVAKCLQKWQEDEITKIEDEAFGARKRGAAASRRMRSTLGLFPLRLEGSAGTLRLLQLPMRECAEPYRLGFDVLEKVLQHAVVGRLRAALINEWQPEKEGEEELSAYANSISASGGALAAAAAGRPGAADSTGCYRCLAVVEKWFAALPVSCVRQLTEEAVVPKLLQGINAWDPSKARVPIHLWLQPWLPYLTREHLQLLSLPLQVKIAAALDEKWHPADRSAVGLLLPWKNVFDAYSFAALLQRSVMPKLHDHLLNMPVRPDHQRLEPLQDVLAWVPLLPVEMLVNLFLTAFFPRWLQVLRVWLGTPQVDLTEVLEWYGGWKQIFPPSLLAHPRVQSGVLVEALQLMNFASAAVGMQAVGAPTAAAAGVSPHLQPPAPLGMGATSALPHVSPVHAGPAVPGPGVDPATAAAASASPAYVLHHELGMGGSPYPAPPPTAAPPPPPSTGVAGGNIDAGCPYHFSTVAAAAAASHVSSGAVCSPGVAGIKPVEPEQPISLLDYLEGLAKEKSILFKPKPGRVEEGKQVYAYGRMNMYVKEKLIYVKGKALHAWTAVDVDELLKLAKGEWTKLKGTTYERK